jgi:putative tryptophan/tyrosine transport system substrate-binding protein
MTRPWQRAAAAACLLTAHALAAALPDAAPGTMAPASAAPTIAIVLPREEQPIEAGFREGLRQHGLAPRFAVVRWSGRAEDQAALVAQLRALAPELVYTWGLTTTLAVAGPVDGEAGRYIRDRPVVFTDVDDPVASGLLAQWAPPGRNLTGVPRLAPLAAQVAALRSYRPFRRIGVIVDPADPATRRARDALAPLVQQQGLALVEAVLPLDARGEPDALALPALVRDLAARGAELLYLGDSQFLARTHRGTVTRLAREAGLATFCAAEGAVRQSGCLFGLFSEARNTGRFAGYKAAQILRGGQRVQDVPVQTLQRFSLLINMPVARELALYPSMAVLQAAEVVSPPLAPLRPGP